ncbi:zinc finger, CCHC-type containing protein [Tanacetum coccineum]|uniref:Zinc finger, CCHC-type containing protein n=1 Tax=Tanacetum coccineum TaxID=301880 RepID=A0ABQ5D7C3_9ASTR
MMVSIPMTFPLANSTEYLVSTVDGTMSLKGLILAEVRLLSTRFHVLAIIPSFDSTSGPSKVLSIRESHNLRDSNSKKMTTSSANNSVFRGFFEKQKLTGPNFIDWYRQLRIVLSIEDKLNYLEQPLPPAPVAPEGQQVAPEIIAAHNAWIKGSKEIVGLMLMTMEPEIQRNLENLHAKGVKNSVCSTSRAGASSDYARFSFLQAGRRAVCQLLRFENEELYRQSRAFGAPRDTWPCINELHAMLKLHEQTLPKNNAPALHVIRAGKIPPPSKREDPTKDSICYKCGKIGHWKRKRNRPQYLAELLKKKKNAASGAGGSGIFTIELNTLLNISYIYDTGCGTHICNTTQGLRASRKLKSGLLACTWAMVNVKLLKQLVFFIYVSRVD